MRRTGVKAAPPPKAGFSARAVFAGLVFAFIFAVVAFLAWSLLFSLTSLPDQYMTYAAYGTSFIAVLLGGRLATIRAGGAGLLNGGIVGLAYALLLGALAALITTSPLSLGLAGLTRPLVDVLAGIIGGIMGNNG
jgi:putative membrane protein (TIGR04086 family)